MGQQGAELPTAGNTGAVEVNPMPHRGMRLRQFGHAVLESVIVNQHGRRHFSENLLQFAPMQPPVQCGVNRAQLAAGKQQVEMLHTVQRQHRHPVAVTDPE